MTVGPKADNHPAVKKAVHCSGNTEIKDFQDGTCGEISATQSIHAYIGPKNKLWLQYEVQQPEQGATYWYKGGKQVNAETSGKPQAKKFKVKETEATAVA